MHKIEGTVKQIQPLENLVEFGQKRNILIEKIQKIKQKDGTTKSIVDIYDFCFWGDKSKKLEYINVGDEVEVTFVFRSKVNEYKGKKFYNYNLKGIDITQEKEVLNEHQNPDRVIEEVDLPF